MECILLELVSQRCAEAAGELLHQGFKGPIQTIAVGLNGSFIFGDFYEEDIQLEWEMKGHGLEPGEFQLPVNISLLLERYIQRCPFISTTAGHETWALCLAI